MKINLNGVEVRVITARSNRALKTVDLEFTAQDELKVILPTAVEVDVDNVLKQNWKTLIRKHKEYLTRIPVYRDGKLLINGEPHELIVDNTGETREVILTDPQILIRTCEENRPEPILKQWMTEQTKALVESIQQKHELEIPAHLRIVDTARWGYVRDKTIHVNNQLITLPPKLQEFIIVHEHLHLQHMNHGATFQSKLSEIIPDYPLREHELSKYIAIDQNHLFDTQESGEE